MKNDGKTMKQFIIWMLVFVSVLLFLRILSVSPLGRDDTDKEAWGERSGINPVTDALTGCQYLLSPSGGITPRLDGDGRHICQSTNK
jgi:hypothetical protein